MSTMQSSDDLVIVLTTAPDVLLAKRIAHQLVEQGLAACVNLGASSLSIYGWQGQIEGAEEIPMTIKTTADKQDAAIATLLALHPYEVPEVLVLPVVATTEAYGDWVRAQTRQPMAED